MPDFAMVYETLISPVVLNTGRIKAFSSVKLRATYLLNPNMRLQHLNFSKCCSLSQLVLSSPARILPVALCDKATLIPVKLTPTGSSQASCITLLTNDSSASRGNETALGLHKKHVIGLTSGTALGEKFMQTPLSLKSHVEPSFLIDFLLGK